MAIVKGTNGSDLLDTRDGITDGNDFIEGYDGNDTIYAYNGNDWIRGGNGADHINGGNDIDTVDFVTSTAGVWIDLKWGEGYTGAAKGDTFVSIENVNGSVHDDLLIGNDEANVLVGYWGKDTLKGGGGADRLVGGEDNDTLEGGAGADFLDGGLGIDAMSGGTGNDIYYVDANDTITELAGAGNDTVYSFAYAYALSDNIEILSLAASGATGTYGIGNAQANSIFGNAGSNTLDGRAGADHINGMGGNDTFLFRAGEANGDTIHDFQGNGLGAGDVVSFVGYGSAAQGASFRQLDATRWEISSADGAIHDIVTFANAPTIDATDVSFS